MSRREPVRALLLPPQGAGVIEHVTDVGDVVPGGRTLISAFSFGPMDDQVIDGWHAYHGDSVNVVNRPAYELARLAGWRGYVKPLHGPVLFLGHRDDQDEADVPMALLDAASLLGFLAVADD